MQLSTCLQYTAVHLEIPFACPYYSTDILTPQFCRLNDRTYAAPIRVDVEYTAYLRDKTLTLREESATIGYMPIMLRSCSCVLNGKDEDELARYGECPLDPGGYFIVKGNEKVILIQEELPKNHIIIMTDRKGRVTASVMSSADGIKSKTLVVMDNKKIYLDSNQFTKLIPIIVVLKAMGMESDQEVVQLLSIQECASEGIYTQQQALQYMDGKMKYPHQTTMKVLHNHFLAHVPVKNGNLRAKSIYTGVILRRMMDAVLNADTFDDKDYLGNKRLQLSGELVSLLFEDLFKRMNLLAMDIMGKTMSNNTSEDRDGVLNFKQIIERASNITSGMELAINTGNWNTGQFGMSRKGVSQTLSRLSYMASLGYMTRISQELEKTRKTNGPRALHPSQWGMLCPCDTPEGELCGLTKNLALLTHITTDQEDDGPLTKLCYTLGVEDLSILSAEEVHASDSFLIMFNGSILGKHRQPQRFADNMRKLRRLSSSWDFVSIFVNQKQRCIHIASDGGRVCRPLLIADLGISRVQDHHMQELRAGQLSFDDFLRFGLIEYLDVNEENNALIALYEHEDQDDVQRSRITHIEIEPLTILGVVAGLIPYPHHNQSTRNTYQCAMGKQAMGNIAYNQLSRADSLQYLLVYAQRPLVTTKTIELVGYDKLGAGQNATVAVMSDSGYDIKDAIVFNKSSLDRGFGHCIRMKRYTVAMQKYGNNRSEKNVKPERDKDDILKKQNMQVLDKDGYAKPGLIIRDGDIYVNKKTPKNTAKSPGVTSTDRDYEDSPAIYKGDDDETTVVDRVILSSDSNDNLTIKCIIRHTRRPEVGDKFSSRHGQKGVCGTILQQEDFSFSERGICPDLVMNPHGFPSGMTVGQMLELLGGKAGASCEQFYYGSAFGEPSGNANKVEDMSYTLVKHGFNYHGKDLLYSGTLGHPLQAYIFMGPIYYQKLKHMVLDKMHARASGPRVALTRQPTGGPNSNGGLRLGEMERDCLIAHGASMVIFERLLLSSDPYQVQVCRKCGLLGYYNHRLKTSFCSFCKSGENMQQLMMPYACKLLFQELTAMNIVPRLKLTEG
ncbi:DNA-directed RNA polymerase III subunit 2-like [Triticum dicoccoides]|uniref:DNA-directed RNA polymerase III subunit 2-like n=1 Tax=Triticum dicoccoides TaxID=85692 RepID=UPI00188F92CC|nr:DNA-directed RNA polymerase III subunit 2-like [Triticum dicoccoides]